jgi:hypothetical protein
MIWYNTGVIVWVSMRDAILYDGNYKVRAVIGVDAGSDIFDEWEATLIGNRFYDLNESGDSYHINDIDDVWIK